MQHPYSVRAQELPLWSHNGEHTAVAFLDSSLFLGQRWLVVFAECCDLESTFFALGEKDRPRITSIGTVDALAVKEDGGHS